MSYELFGLFVTEVLVRPLILRARGDRPTENFQPPAL